MERDFTLRFTCDERQGEKDLLWNSLEHQSRQVLESESPVVLRTPDQTAALSIQVFQP
jgi:hypothetical protein